MAQPNVVREPSMDEILASIRRIIESNEPVTQASVATAMAEPEGFSGRPANDDSEEVTLTVDEVFVGRHQDYAPLGATSSVVRAVAGGETHAGTYARPAAVSELRRPEMAQQSFQPVQPPQKALSLADVAARVRAASERTSMVMRELASSQSEEAEQTASVMPQPTAPVVVAEPAQARQAVEEVRQPEDEALREFAVDTRVLPTEAEHDEEETSYRAESVSILSSSAGEQVARSFQDLALALEDAERRSLDQIAEDMLRPMLQEWLDDNLPTLVERLVREEIERVARGPRR